MVPEGRLERAGGHAGRFGRVRALPAVGGDALPGRAAAGLVVVALAAACGSHQKDPPLLVPWHRVGDISLGESKERVIAEYGKQGRYGYRLHGGSVWVAFDHGHVTAIGVNTTYYRTNHGFGVGSRIPVGNRRWHGFVWNAWTRERPCRCWVKVGRGRESLAVTAKNFLKPWTFVYTRNGRVTQLYFASNFVD